MNSSAGSPLPATDPLYPRASGEKRLLNFVIDSITCFAITVGLELVTNIYAGSFSTGRFWSVFETWSPFALVLVATAYYLFMELFTQRTLGKILTNTLVETIAGEKPTLGQFVTRTFARFLPFELFTFLGPSGEGLHDSLSETRVIDTSKPPVFFKKNNPNEQRIRPSEGKPIPIDRSEMASW
ncbi:MAG: RDD family protein [Roseibacillus sp.]